MLDQYYQRGTSDGKVESIDLCATSRDLRERHRIFVPFTTKLTGRLKVYVLVGPDNRRSCSTWSCFLPIRTGRERGQAIKNSREWSIWQAPITSLGWKKRKKGGGPNNLRLCWLSSQDSWSSKFVSIFDALCNVGTQIKKRLHSEGGKREQERKVAKEGTWRR